MPKIISMGMSLTAQPMPSYRLFSKSIESDITPDPKPKGQDQGSLNPALAERGPKLGQAVAFVALRVRRGFGHQGLRRNNGNAAEAD